MTKQVVTFGEIMMRLSTPGAERFGQAHSYDVVFGGSEANVGISLSRFGIPTAHVTQLPKNDLGETVVQYLRSCNVDTQYVRLIPGRLGLYFLENGAMHRSSKIIYDRSDSAFTHLQGGQLPWKEIMKNASWFHWSGITPALSAGAADACREAIEAAREFNVPVSGDINYRRNLWQYGKAVKDVMTPLIAGTQHIVGGLVDIGNCLGIQEKTYEDACQRVTELFPTIKTFSYTERTTISASDQTIQGVMWSENKLLKSTEYQLSQIIDRIGAGDAFMAGLIYGQMHQKTKKETLEFAAAACALKHSISGDANRVSVEEVNALLSGENIGRLLR